ncbi:PRD domain-containing protein [Breznakia pachnodae]|uniref:Beta-glucoside operon transcriptional antiterminator n=1 Tax=Breznakia pachnodae TaxID=265178 RepID=A0ABU0E8H6_9FIRM|nr:PRD domain-containing protein [Breznakia pachnodae]MDQ0363019.1 beta-glucoside operon transcriptional antiterminator [Breznakia pachnodae]
MKVVKRLNNNVVIADDKGQEIILSGRGLGFGVYPNDEVNEELIERRYVFDKRDDIDRWTQSLNSIPIEVFSLSEKIVETVKEKFNCKLSPNIIITLADHIDYAISRHKEYIELRNPLKWDINLLYPEEIEMAKVALDIVNDEMNIRLSDDEVSFIAMHFVNARSNEGQEMSETLKVTKILADIISIIQITMKVELNEESFHYTRLLTHIRYFINRQLHNETVDTEIDTIDTLIRDRYPKEFNCSQVIAKYLLTNYGWEIGEEEKIFLTIHIIRVVSKAQEGEKNEN